VVWEDGGSNPASYPIWAVLGTRRIRICDDDKTRLRTTKCDCGVAAVAGMAVRRSRALGEVRMGVWVRVNDVGCEAEHYLNAVIEDLFADARNPFWVIP